MSPFPAPRPVVSGRPYLVHQVAGELPGSHDDFLGTTRFDIDLDGDAYTVCGTGVPAGGASVHVYEKADEGAGKDVRVWSVGVDAPTRSFLAEHDGLR